MSRPFAIGALIGLAALLAGAPAVEAQKKGAKDKEGTTSEKMVKAGQLVGKVAAVYENRKEDQA